jgi:aminoglycoside N3'-acetyltransferase
VVEFSEHGARVLADHHRLEVERVSCRVVRRRDTWQTVKEEDKQNEQLLELSNQILELTRAIHEYTSPQARTPSSGSGGGS